ncbi:MAG: carbon-nitrogen hydrolase family protein [Promethearchaeota archaeon]
MTILGLVQMGMGIDQKENIQKALDYMEQAAKANVDIICFPEISFNRFFPQRPTDTKIFQIAEPIPGDLVAKFQKAAAEFNMVTIINFYEEGEIAGFYYDTSPVIDSDGELLGKVRMTHICEERGCHEKFYYFEPTEHTAFQVFQTLKGNIGISICYDRHFAEIYRYQALNGAELILTPTAITIPEPQDMFEVELRAHSFDNQVFTAFCNRVGKEDALEFSGNSFVVNQEGKIISQAKTGSEELLIVDLHDMREKISKTRNNRMYLRDLRKDLYPTN